MLDIIDVTNLHFFLNELLKNELPTTANYQFLPIPHPRFAILTCDQFNFQITN